MSRHRPPARNEPLPGNPRSAGRGRVPTDRRTDSRDADDPAMSGADTISRDCRFHHARPRMRSHAQRLNPFARGSPISLVAKLLCDSGACGCAALEVAAFPARLRRWTPHSRTPRATTATAAGRRIASGRAAALAHSTHHLTCAVERRCIPAGANPARQLSLQPEAVGAVQGGNELD